MGRYRFACAAFALLALAVGGCATSRPTRTSEVRADPSQVIATELAFARAAQEKGQWRAFADFSTDEAVMFVPEAVNAHQWLKGRANPPVAVTWQPHQVWASCDGSLAVTKGPWQRPQGVGYFTTVWRRTRDGIYKWVMDQGDELKEPLPEPEMIQAKVADCAGANLQVRRDVSNARPAIIRPTTCQGDRCEGGGTSADASLEYRYVVTPAGREFTVQLRQDGAMREVLRSQVSAE